MQSEGAKLTPATLGDSHAAQMAAGGDLSRIHQMILQTRELVRHVNDTQEAVLLVRRSNATDKLVDDALKTYQLLDEEQFQLKQDAAEVHLRTQRRAGELLLRVIKHAGGRPSSRSASESRRQPTLQELGIDGNESHRWQRIASLPEDAFENYIADSREQRRELTTAAMVSLAARSLRRERDDAEGEARPGDSAPLLAVYERARVHISNLLSTDAEELASLIAEERRQRTIDELGHAREWFDRFEGALEAAVGAES
jgi:hypothetical protein